jgi:acyl carrier protein
VFGKTMDNLKERLSNCFQTVFPDLSEADVPGASHESLTAWDSVASLTLVNVIEEEFGIEMDFDVLGDLTTFDLVYQYLQKETAKS